MKHLFAYGTLMCREIFQQVTGLALTPVPARLTGYSRWAIQGEDYPAIIPDPVAQVEGVLYCQIPPSVWSLLDQFEGPGYRRESLKVELAEQILHAESYVLHPEWRHRLSWMGWDYEQFLRDGKARFEREYQGFAALATMTRPSL